MAVNSGWDGRARKVGQRGHKTTETGREFDKRSGIDASKS